MAQPSICCGLYHSLAIKADGTVAAWGNNEKGQCNVPAGLSGVMAIGAGGIHSLALKANGTVAAWGDNIVGQCNVPAGLSGVLTISVGGYHSLALRCDGTVIAWGDNGTGQCNVPAGLSGVVAIAAGYYHSLALRSNGTLVAWGYTNDGQCSIPAELGDIVSIATGEKHSVALKADGTVVAWGNNEKGQCNVPAGLNRVIGIATNFNHNLALQADGTVVAWGNNWYGQCDVPVGLSGITAIAAGVYHSLVLRADGTMMAWGNNWYGQRNIPVGLAARQPASTHVRFDLTPLAPGLLSVQALAGTAIGLSGAPTQASNVLWRNMAMPGSLKVAIQPVQAVVAGAQWRRTDTTGWLDNGTSESRVAPGIHTIEFKPIADWVMPTTRTVTIISNQAAQTTGTYTYQLGQLKVSIAPAGAVTAGAQWRRTGTPTWRDSDNTETRIAPGNYPIEFKEIGLTGLTQPTSINAAISSGTTSTILANYGTPGVAITLTSTAPDPSNSPIMVNASFNVPVVGFSATDLITTNALVSRVQGMTQQTSLAGSLQSLALRAEGTVATWGDNTYGQCNVPAGLHGVVAVAAGYLHSMALLNNGTMTCWGNNSYGQSSTPAGLSGVVAIAAGGMHSLALKSDGKVAVWGDNSYKQCNLPAGLSGVVSIAAGHLHSVALKADGTVTVWGETYEGQANIPAGLNGVVAIAAGYSHCLALKNDGTVVSWGGNGVGQCSMPMNLRDVVAIAARSDHSLALEANGTVIAWGSNDYGESNVPAGLSQVVAVAAGDYHSLALRADGTVVAWGLNNKGQCNLPAGLIVRQPAMTRCCFSLDAIEPKPVAVYSPIGAGASLGGGPTLESNMLQRNILPFGSLRVQIEPSLAVTAGARWRRFGTTEWRESDSVECHLSPGDLTVEARDIGLSGWTLPAPIGAFIANGTTTTVQVHYDAQPVTVTLSSRADDPALAPVPVTAVFSHPVLGFTTASLATTNAMASNLRGITVQSSIALGSNHSLALRPDGTLAAWGRNAYGAATAPADHIGIIAIAASSDYSLALKADGTVVAWGSAGNPPAGLGSVVAISTYSGHSLALRSDGTVIAWGSNFNGEGTVPAGLQNIVAICAAPYRNLALKADGTVVAWGLNSSGESNVPPGLSDVIAVAAGSGFNLALKADGTVVAWGYNHDGQCNVPLGLKDVVAIKAGYDFSLALKANGTVAAWGNNSSNQCNVPIGLANVVEICAGLSHNLAIKADGTAVAWGYNTHGQCDVPAGLIVRKPSFSRCRFNMTPLTTGLVSVQAPAGVAASLGGIPSQASNVLQRNLILPGSLVVEITPSIAVTAGAKWRRVGTTTWLDGNTTESNIMPSEYMVEFKPVDDWNTPANQTVKLISGQTTIISGDYVRQTGSLQVTISPPEAVTAGACWKRVGTPNWLASGGYGNEYPNGELYY